LAGHVGAMIAHRRGFAIPHLGEKGEGGALAGYWRFTDRRRHAPAIRRQTIAGLLHRTARGYPHKIVDFNPSRSS
jgi:hypothetical protein